MSNKSLVQIVMALQQRVAALEAGTTPAIPSPNDRIAYLEAKLHALSMKYMQLTTPETKTARQLCPKCREKPNHFFHVKYCTGQKEEQKDADTDRRRDQGTP